jgi:hypothetical protein
MSTKGFRKINVAGENFYWKVRKRISHEEAHNGQLGIPIQHESKGQLLFVYIGFRRSKDYGMESIQSVTPSIIKNCITEAIKLGWQFKTPGRPISLVNGKLTRDTRTAKWAAD